MNGTPKDTEPPGSRSRRATRQNGAAVRALREKDGWSQEALAKAAGISQAGLSQIETESASAHATTLNRIARKLHVPVDAIMRVRAEAEPEDVPEPEGAAAA